MKEVGDHVFHTQVQANGIITEIDDTKRRDKYKVNFPWAKYCEVRHGTWIERGSKGTKWQWCSDEQLTKLHMPIMMDNFLGQNKVTTLGKRSLDRLIRLQTGLKKRKARDGSDVIINYGTLWNPEMTARVPSSIFMVNRNLIMNKLTQMKMMGEELCPESTMVHHSNKDEWIIKPFKSIGGRNIRPATNSSRNNGEYYQRKFDKVREFRVHCFMWADNPVPFIQEKVIGDPNQLCWNKKQGGRFRYVYQDGLSYGKFANDLSKTSRNMMTKMALDACCKLGYDMGGIDFGMDVNGQFKIFEVNSRMGLRERSFFTYKRAFAELRTLNINNYLERKRNAC